MELDGLIKNAKMKSISIIPSNLSLWQFDNFSHSNQPGACTIKHYGSVMYKLWGAGKTTYLLSASFRNGNVYIWQAILT